MDHIERVAAPTTQSELRALLDRDVPLILTGLGTDLPAMHWTVDHLVRQSHGVPLPVIRTDPRLHVPGAGETIHLTLEELVSRLRNGEPPVRHYLAGVDMFKWEEQLKQLIGECEGFYRARVVKTRVGALGMWLGAHGQRTWAHFDCAHNFLLMIRGRKTFRLAAPSEYPNLYTYTFSSCNGQDMDGEIYRFSEVSAWNPDFEKYPRARKVKWYEATIERGETLLVPLGWWHAVESLGDADGGFNIALNLFFDAEPSDWEKRKYMKSFKQQYANH